MRNAVCCLGSINRDLVYRLPHIVRPGETLAATALEQHPGGKGANQSVALARAGARVRHCGQVGSDGADLVALLAAEGIDVRHIACDNGRSGHAIIQLAADGENAIVLDAGANARISAAAVDAALADCRPGDVLLVQNETAQVAHAIAAAHAAGLRVWCNPAPFHEGVRSLPLHLLDSLVVNHSEAAGLAELPLSSPAENILDQLCRRWPQARIILTLGGAGALVREPGGPLLVSPASPAQVVDTTAAGDTFLGYCLARHLAGDDLPRALVTASRAAALCVSRPGAIPAIPLLAELGS